MSFDLEARRQHTLLAALANPQPDRGLAAYCANALASAERALAAIFGTVQAMLGAADFKQLAREFWHAHPPLRGDLAEWGAALPDWLADHIELAAWPYLADAARLDLARHDAERAADATLDVASFGLLQSTDPVELRLLPMPGMTLLDSRWPIATIHAAHQPAIDADADAPFAAVRAALDEGRGEAVLVARRGWRAEVHRLDAVEAAWITDILSGVRLAEALDRAGPAFDFGAWLAVALREPWLKGVALAHDSPVRRQHAAPPPGDC